MFTQVTNLVCGIVKSLCSSLTSMLVCRPLTAGLSKGGHPVSAEVQHCLESILGRVCTVTREPLSLMSDLEQINTEMARWAASSAAQQVKFNQAGEGATAARQAPATVADPFPDAT